MSILSLTNCVKIVFRPQITNKFYLAKSQINHPSNGKQVIYKASSKQHKNVQNVTTNNVSEDCNRFYHLLTNNLLTSYGEIDLWGKCSFAREPFSLITSRKFNIVLMPKLFFASHTIHTKRQINKINFRYKTDFPQQKYEL